MSVLIKGMEMPKTCVQCDLKRYDQERIWTDNGTELLGAWVCKRTDEIIWNTQRGENCPLVPLPEKHGRLIDADAPVRVVWSDGTIHSTTVSRLLCLHSLLDFQKTIIEAEGGGGDG